MGYAMRTPHFRYIAYVHTLRPHRLPQFDKPLYSEELYDHRNDLESDLGKKELQNLAIDPQYRDILKKHRTELMSFLYNEVVFVNISSTFVEREMASGGGGGGGAVTAGVKKRAAQRFGGWMG